MPEESKFTWIPFYEEFAQKLIEYKDQVDANGYHTILVDKIKSLNSEWTDFLRAKSENKDFADIDPFTVFAIFNRSSRMDRRCAILKSLKELFGVTAEIPEDFDGIPLANAQKTCFYYEHEKKETIPMLWNLFDVFMQGETVEISKLFDNAQKRKGIKWNLTMAFFWMKPKEYMPMDAKSRSYLKKHGVSVFSARKLTGEKYLELIKEIKYKLDEGFPSISKHAFDMDDRLEANGLMVQDNSGPWPDELIEDMDGDAKPGVFWWHEMPVGQNSTVKLIREKINQDGSFEFYIFREKKAVYKAAVVDFVCSQDEYITKKSEWLENDTQWLKDSFSDYHDKDGNRKAKILFYIEAFEKLDEPIPMDRFITSKDYKKPHIANLVPFKKIIKDDIIMVKQKSNDLLVDLLKQKKNIILQGAPGTGKTYASAALALSICDNAVPDNHKDIMKRYDELVKLGRIGFVTFHQSMDYEDFIEGIKPKTNDHDVTYDVEDGIFKSICKNAGKIENKQINSGKIDFSKSRIFKMSLGEKGRNDIEVFDFCFEHNVLALGWGDDKDFSSCKERADFKKMDSSWGAMAVEIFKEWMLKDDIVLIADGTKAIKAIAQIVGDYEYHKDYPIEMCQYRKVKWLYSGDSIPISKLYDKNLSQQTIYAFGTRYKDGKVENGNIKLDVLNDIITGDVKNEPVQNYVLIIDEINRGNISKIFGELISLLEADKRVGEEHPLTVTLPYSKEPFSVPPNLYIIGTMNTTDRSVGSIDYAVRRRFAFVTLEADESLVPEGDARNLFNAVKNFLNESKYDMDIEDLMVGHSYFMDSDNLQMKWQYEILPLLMEYHKDGVISKSPLKDRSGNEIENVKKNYITFTLVWQKKESEETKV